MSQSNTYSQFEAQMQSSQGFKQDKPINEQIEEMMDHLDGEHDSEDEGMEDYKIGGYHPVHIGEILLNRYVVIQKLGWGHFSTVWLAKDFKYDTYVALKIQKSASHYLEAAYDEVEILQKVAQNVQNPVWIQSLKEYYADQGRTSFNRDDTHTVQLLNSFVYKGPYGHHFCMVFEILGVNLLEIIKRYEYKGCPMDIARRMAKQILIGLDYLHRICGVIHTDLKPENVLVCLSDEEIKDIVENGQLTSNQLFSDRIHIYRQMLGIVEDKPIVEQKNTVQKQEEEDLDTQSTNLTKTQKRKQLRKKKQQQQKQQQNEFFSQYNELQEHERPKSIKELFQQQQKISFTQQKKLPDNFRLKIADLGNACWIHHHFSTLIQTRQYRSPEVLLGVKYNATADIWSLACMILSNSLIKSFYFQIQKIKICNQLFKDFKQNDIQKMALQFCWKRLFNFIRNISENLNLLINCQLFVIRYFLIRLFYLIPKIIVNTYFFKQYKIKDFFIKIQFEQIQEKSIIRFTIFEMLTGEFLFEPRQGPNSSKNEEHLAQMQEMLGKFPLEYSTRGEKAKRYFTNDGQMKRIPQLNYWITVNGRLIKRFLKEKIQYCRVQNYLLKSIKIQIIHIQLQIVCNREIQIQISRSFIICFIYDAYVTLLTAELLIQFRFQIQCFLSVPEYRTSAQEVLKRELCSNNLDESQRLAQLKKYIDQIFAFQNFRNNIPNSGWLNAKTDQLIGHKMNDEEFRKYNKQKKANEEIEQYDQNYDGFQPTLLSNYRRAQTRSYDGSNSQTPQQDKVIKKEGKYVDHRVIDRSFTDLGYIGYGDGIDLEQLDSTGNWQFS